jgi:branched-chain amino acid transport system ATP-binding protein
LRRPTEHATPAGSDEGLHIVGVGARREQALILRDVNLNAPLGEVTVILGPNGAGKTTLLEAISGALDSTAGTMWFSGTSLVGLSRPKRAKLGIAHVEQGRTIFGDLTTEENIRVALPNARFDDVADWFPELIPRRHIAAGMLSGGEQQMLVIARALVTLPKILLLDEMSLGLAPRIVQRLLEVIRVQAARGLGVVLVEQYAHLALEVGTRATVLSGGQVVFEGSCAELRSDPELLRRAYLGTVSRDASAGRIGNGR